MTPRSGWWSCASGRGGGLVLFLEIMRAVRKAHTARTVIFTANSGHELGHLGLDHFIEEEPNLEKMPRVGSISGRISPLSSIRRCGSKQPTRDY
jgi:hypothetical protein